MKPASQPARFAKRFFTLAVLGLALGGLAGGASWLFAADVRIKTATIDPAGRVQIAAQGDPGAMLQLLSGPTVTNINAPVASTQASSTGEAQFNVSAADSAAFFCIVSLPLTTLSETSPLNGEGGVSVTRETIVRFSAPLAANAMVGTNHFYATVGGRRILSRVELSSDRRTATLFYLEPLPGGTRIYGVFDGTGLSDHLGQPLDADGDGQLGGAAAITFDTLSTTSVPDTIVTGSVFASEQRAAGNGQQTTDVPLEGVIITVDGREQDLRAVTDAQGNFTLANAPAGRFFVHIDGRKAKGSDYPNGAFYPFVGKAWDALPGQTNLAGENTSTNRGNIYLPLIRAGTLQPVSLTNDTIITFPPSVISSNPALARVELTIPANALFNEAGTRGGRVGIAPVPPDRLPGALPPGLDFPIVFTVQTDGAQNFDRPAPVRFPNLPDPVTGQKLAPGEKTSLWSFNHDLGRWEVVDSMTVTPDGNFVESDPGIGIRQPGWAGVNPGVPAGCDMPVGPTGPKPGPPLPPPPGPPCPNDIDCDNKPDDQDDDIDGDGDPNSTDPDDDGDGVNDEADNCPIKQNPDQTDSDGDGIGDACDDSTEELIEVRAASFIPCQVILFPPPFITLGKGDNRSYQYEGSSRVFLSATINVDPLRLKTATLKEPPQRRSDETVVWPVIWPNAPTGPPKVQGFPVPNEPWWCWGLIDGYSGAIPIYSTKLSPTPFSHIIEVHPQNPNFTYIRFGMHASIPIPVSPAQPDWYTIDIDAELTVSILHQKGKSLQYALQGAHDGFPAFEVYVNKIRIYDYDPRDPDAQESPFALGGDMDRPVQVGWTPLSSKLLVPQPFTVEESLPSIATPIFFAMVNLETGTIEQRGIVRNGILPDVVLAPRSRYQVLLFEPTSPLVGSREFTTPESGRRVAIARIPMRHSFEIDHDGDGISDFGEVVVGTNQELTDTDDDGIPDGIEVQQGTDPLDGKPARIGMLASASVPGTAVDVCALNDIAIVAGGEAGVTVFNVLNALSPVRVVQVDTPGNARRVSCDRDLIAVADGAAGLAVVDISDPPNARVIQQVNLGAPVQAVATASGIAYVGTDKGRLAAVDMTSGTILQSIPLGDEIRDLAFGGDVLYALTPTRLVAIAEPGAGMRGAGAIDSPSRNNGNRRLFVGGGVAFAVHDSGFNTFGLGDAERPALIAAGNSQQFDWKQMVVNGSGLALVAGSAIARENDPHDIWLYDVRDPKRTDGFLTQLPTPGIARAASIYNGLAYVADGTAGLQVLNYLAFDTKKQPPTIALTASFPLSSPTAGSSEEGQLARVTANVTDDVQVRNVEFYIDGQLVISDGNFPFEHRFVTPKLAAAKTSLTLRAKATDTGGNSTWSDEITVTLTPDATPPHLIRTFPRGFDVVGSLNAVAAYFNEPLEPASLSAGAFQVFAAGPDGRLGTSDDVLVPSGGVSYRDTLNAVFLNLGSGLPAGMYRAVLRRPLADAAGNQIASDVAWQFWVLGAQDSDQDGVPDEREAALGLDPNNPDSDGDCVLDGDEDLDGDGLASRWEFLLGYDPQLRDTGAKGLDDGKRDQDFDSLSDADEVKNGTNPFVIDSDGDGWDDATELADNTSPVDPRSGPVIVIASPLVNALNGALDEFPKTEPVLIVSPIVAGENR